jgi:hypothetical protein
LSFRRQKLPRMIVAVTGCCASIWVLFATYFGPQIVASAYYGKSARLLNSLISGQSTHPLSHYLEAWRLISFEVLWGLLLLGFAAVIATRPTVQSAVWGERAMTQEQARYLTGTRLLVIYIVLGVIVGGSLFCIATETERWPFSSYPMYSKIQQTYSLTQFRLYGVMRDEGAKEFPLVEYRYTQPFDNARIDASFARLYAHPAQEQLLKEALRDFHSRYEALREQGRHSGPPLRGLRLYKVVWTLDPLARNVNDPDRRELLAEGHQDNAQGRP